jgi:hypothetical protein
LVVWSDGAHVYKNGYAIVARTYDSTGAFTRGDFLVSDDPNSDDTSPAVAVLSNGDIAVAYEHNYFENRVQQEDLEVKVYYPALHLVRTDVIQTRGTCRPLRRGPAAATSFPIPSPAEGRAESRHRSCRLPTLSHA